MPDKEKIKEELELANKALLALQDYDRTFSQRRYFPPKEIRQEELISEIKRLSNLLEAIDKK